MQPQQHQDNLAKPLIEKASEYSAMCGLIERLQARGQITALSSVIAEIKAGEESALDSSKDPAGYEKCVLGIKDNLKLVVQILGKHGIYCYLT